MNILFLAPHPFFANRGTPIAVREALCALSEQGHRIDVLTYHEGDDVDIDNVTIHRINKPPLVKSVPIGPSWQKGVCDVSFMFKAIGLARENRYDVVHAVEESAFMAGLIRRLFGTPFIFDMDSLMSLQIREKSAALAPIAMVFQWLERRSIKRSAGVLAVCPALVDEAMRFHPTENVALLPDIPFTGQAEGELPEALTGATGTRIMYVGNLETYQGIDLLVDAFMKIAGDCPDATLVVVGGSPEHIAEYTQRAGELCAQGRVRFVGPLPIEQLGRVMAHTDILASPRKQGNNTPMKIYSYLQSGKAVIATDLPTHTQVLSRDVAKLVAPTVDAFAQGLKELLDSPQERINLGERGSDYVEANFSPAAFRKRLRDFYRTITAATADRTTEKLRDAAPGEPLTKNGS